MMSMAAPFTDEAMYSAIAELLLQTDAVAEVHNTIRASLPVELVT